jgi:DNA invertase Pin-like site-specific DNA recombinase
MSYWWDTHAYQQSNKISPPSATDSTRSASVDDRVYVDHGLTGTNRDRPGLRLALAACRAGDTLAVTKLDPLARSLPDARDILDELTKCNVKLSLGGSIHDRRTPSDDCCSTCWRWWPSSNPT